MSFVASQLSCLPLPPPAGLGPTLEFYTLLSHELQRKSLGLWRDSSDSSEAEGGGKGGGGSSGQQGGGAAAAEGGGGGAAAAPGGDGQVGRRAGRSS